MILLSYYGLSMLSSRYSPHETSWSTRPLDGAGGWGLMARLVVVGVGVACGLIEWHGEMEIVGFGFG